MKSANTLKKICCLYLSFKSDYMKMRIENISSQEIDFGIGCITATNHRREAVDFTRGYLEEHFAILTKAPRVLDV